MQILVEPEELVKCGVWDSYAYYIVSDSKESERILTENKQFELSTRDALVIGLLKVVETPNLIHRFNQFVGDYLNIKSQKQSNLILASKKGLLSLVDKFLNKYPDYWVPDTVYEKALTELVDYINTFKEGIEELEIHEVTNQFGTHEFVNANHVKKLLLFNY